MCGLVSVLASPDGLEDVPAFTRWPLSDPEAQLLGMGQETGWTEA